MDNIDLIIGRLGKIKALENRAGTPAEAQAAAAAMSRLLIKHNLTLEDVSTGLEKASRGEVGSDVYATGNRAVWRHVLMNVIAKAHMCRCIRLGTSDGKGTIVGHAHNLTVVRELYDWLVVEVERLADEAWEVAKKRTWESGRAWKNSYRLGVITGIADSFREARRAEMRDASDSWGVVPVIEQEVDERFNQMFSKTATYSSRSSGSGWGSGYSAGKSINTRQINPGMKALRG